MKASRVVLTAVSSLLLTACGGGSNKPVETISLDCSIPTDELFAAAARDAIPSLTNPEVAGSLASFMEDDDRVLGVVVNGEPRAYPFGILWWHEIVNDTLSGLQDQRLPLSSSTKQVAKLPERSLMKQDSFCCGRQAPASTICVPTERVIASRIFLPSTWPQTECWPTACWCLL